MTRVCSLYLRFTRFGLGLASRQQLLGRSDALVTVSSRSGFLFQA